MVDIPKIMVSSTVYYTGDILDQLFVTLEALGYEVWMSKRGTIPLIPGSTAFDCCLKAVDDCDIFLGLINGYYGSGKDESGVSISHKELVRAVDSRKTRFLLVDYDVTIARSMIRALRRAEKDTGNSICDLLKLRPEDPISDLNVVDMYEYATQLHVPDINHRESNWVQPYYNAHDIMQFVNTQLGDPEKFIK